MFPCRRERANRNSPKRGLRHQKPTITSGRRWELEKVYLHLGRLQWYHLHKLRDGLQGPLQQEEVAGIPGPHGSNGQQDFCAENRVTGFVENILQYLECLKILDSHP